MKYISYYEILNNLDDGIILNGDILIGKTLKSYLIGPKITPDFDVNSFKKRITSNCIYDINIYKKKISSKKVSRLLDLYYFKIKKKEIYEIKKRKIIIHKIISVPGDNYEKK